MATCAKRRTKGGRVRKPLEVVLVCSPPREHFRWIVRAALLARLPIFGMTLSVMSPADRLATMIPIATVSRVGKQHVVAFIVTDRVATALRFREPPRRTAQAAGSCRRWFDRWLLTFPLGHRRDFRRLTF